MNEKKMGESGLDLFQATSWIGMSSRLIISGISEDVLVSATN